MTSPARFPTKRRKWAGSHSRREGSDQVVPPPERRTVVGRLEESVMMEATEVSVGAEAWGLESFAPPVLLVGPLAELPSGREPRGAVLALVAAPLPSSPDPPPPNRRFRATEEEELSLSLDA